MPGSEHDPRARKPIVVATLVATPSMMARMGCKEDNANPRVSSDNATDHTTIASAGKVFLVALLKVKKKATMASESTLGAQTPTI